jgi:DNA-binding MarR family transcriptional regulator
VVRAAASRNRQSPGASREVRAALDAFRRIVQALRTTGREGERRTGISSAQLFALQQIAEHPGASINDVARLTFTHQSSVSVVIRRLVKRRLVVKVAPAYDRRRQHLAPTAAGRRVIGRAPEPVQERLIAAILTLPAADRRALARALTIVSRLVTPARGQRHPPMLFEDGRRGSVRARRHRG